MEAGRNISTGIYIIIIITMIFLKFRVANDNIMYIFFCKDFNQLHWWMHRLKDQSLISSEKYVYMVYL